MTPVGPVLGKTINSEDMAETTSNDICYHMKYAIQKLLKLLLKQCANGWESHAQLLKNEARQTKKTSIS